jgi:ubiquinone/menaquinone biosynthesis C-methylase UbiE
MPHTETDTARHALARWCVGAGLDIGFGGGAPIVRNAICLDRAFGTLGRANHFGDDYPTHLVRDAFEQLPFLDCSLDYVYSSHTLEDAVDTAAVLIEWCRVIKEGGFLVLFLPDQVAYEARCRIDNTIPNQDHKYAEFSLAFVRDKLPESMQVVQAAFPVSYNPYSFELVAKKRYIPVIIE